MAFDMVSLATVTLPKLTRRERDAKRLRMGNDRADAIVTRLALVTMIALRDGRIATKFAFEAAFRASLRSDLCLQGWRWDAADHAAMALTGAALARIGAKRPTWNEGQPEYVIHAGLLIARSRCATCHGPLTGDQRKFCSSLCNSTHHERIARIMGTREAEAQGAVNV